MGALYQVKEGQQESEQRWVACLSLLKSTSCNHRLPGKQLAHNTSRALKYVDAL